MVYILLMNFLISRTKSGNHYISLGKLAFGSNQLRVALFRNGETEKISVYATIRELAQPTGVSYQTLARHSRLKNVVFIVDKTFVTLCQAHDVRFINQPTQHYVEVRDMEEVIKSACSTKLSSWRTFQETLAGVISDFHHTIAKAEVEDESRRQLTCCKCNADNPNFHLCQPCSDGNLRQVIPMPLPRPERWCNHCNHTIPSRAHYSKICTKCLNVMEQPERWPTDVDYSNSVRIIQGRSMKDYCLPSESEKTALRKLPEDHPAYGHDESMGLFGDSRIVYSRRNQDANVIGYYAGVYLPAGTVPFNPYIMCSDDYTPLVWDAFSFGNKTRFVNAYNGVAHTPNAKIGDLCPVQGAPDWVKMRPIIITRTIEAGEEIVLDYGEQYWRALGVWKEDNTQPPVVDQRDEVKPWMQPGALVEVDMDQVSHKDLEGDAYRSSLFFATLIAHTDTNAIVSLLGVEGFQVPRQAVFPPRGGVPQAVFHPGQDVEVLWQNPGTSIPRTDMGWWPATIICREEADSDRYHVIYKAAFNGYASQDVVHAVKIRPATQDRMPVDPVQKKRKTVSEK